MSEDVYALKVKVPDGILEDLNGQYNELPHGRFNQAMNDMEGVYSIDQAEDWISALKSGKKIVNPMSPKEIFRKNYYSAVDDIKDNPDDNEARAFKAGMDTAHKYFAKEHPDLREWLDGDKDD